ncbi:MAG: putative sensor protein [Pedosphaera sp.]|nr:putative sensor protein [Pedosphaera sp.]
MNQVLRVLVAEDSENDTELMLRELRRGGYETKSERVDTPEAMRKALQEREWDLVVSDYVMPGFGGLDALELFNEMRLDIPFIIVSGQIGEDVAVEAMRAGARDYIMKDRMARLVPAVTRELREAKVRQDRRKADRALRESEERFRQLAENVDVVFFMFDRPEKGTPGQALYVSPAYEIIWGRSVTGLYHDARSWLKSVYPEDRDKVLAGMQEMDRGEFNQEFRIVGLDMRMRWIHYRTFPVINEHGTVYRIAGIAEDITARKVAEEQLAANARQLEMMVEELRAIDAQLRLSNREILQSRADLEKRVHERTIDLTAANAELQCQIGERMRLERELLEIAEQERRRIGFDLHDDLSQKLMGISFMIKALECKVANRDMPRVTETRRIQMLINQVINHTRDLAHDFSNLDLQGDDLAVELKGLAAKMKKMFQISCQFSSKGELPSLTQNVAAQLYKIAQEAASNAVKHGKAKLVIISLYQQGNRLMLTIKNNGLPFPGIGKSSDGMGLRIMKSRAGLIGAALEVRANGGNGLIVTCILPLTATTKPAPIKVELSQQHTHKRNGQPLAMACN